MSESTTYRPDRRNTMRGRRTWPAKLVGMVAVLATVATGCSGDSEADGNADGVKQISQEELLNLPRATTYGKLPDAPKDPNPGKPATSTVVRVHEEVPVYDAQGGEPMARMPAKQLGSPTWLSVIAKKKNWYHVLLPARPNGATGWIHDGGEDITTKTTNYRVKVNLDEYRLTVTKNGKEEGSWEVGIGKDKHPTPTGRTSITSVIKETKEDYTPYVLPLGMHSEVLTSYGGGPGTVGIHGWPSDDVLGTKTSDGCIRVPSDALNKIRTLPLGTSVLIA